MDKDKTERVLELVTSCFTDLEKAEVLTNLLEESVSPEKTVVVTLSMIFSFIRSAENLILKIQDEVK